MDALLTGIYAHYTAANPFKTACTGGLHFETAPQGTSMPYATYQLVTGRPEYYFDGNFEIAHIQFDIYAATNAVRQDLYTKLTARFDDCRPAVVGYDTMIMERVFQQPLLEGEEGQIYRYIVEYSVRIDNP